MTQDTAQNDGPEREKPGIEENVVYQKPALSDEARAELIDELTAICGKETVSSSETDRVAYSRDYWPITLRWMIEGKIAALPDAIVWPKTTRQVEKLAVLANEKKIPLIPFGEGSGVMGSAIARNGGIMVDMKHMAKIVKIDDKNLVVTVQPGINGMNLERELNTAGFTLAHVPQSFYCSTVGGWIGCRAAGQFSTKYGKIDDMVLALEAVLPDGTTMHSKPVPKSSTGPRVDMLHVGAEGTLGIVTEVTLKIWPYPEKKCNRSFSFKTLDDALETVRKILRRGIYPAVIRIYDKDETKRHFYDTPDAKNRQMVIFVMQGDAELVELENKIVEKVALAHNGTDCGEEPVKHWYERRFKVKETSDFAPRDIVFDTIEVTATWDKALPMYKAMVAAMKKVKGVLLATAHASHFYPQGVCFYFTFGGTPQGSTTPNDFYNEVWGAAMTACLKSGGSISHHHGIGLMRSAWIAEELGGGHEALKKIKHALDPNDIMNPGKLGL